MRANRKAHQQLCTGIGPQVAAMVLSNYWQVALASIYVCISVR